MSIQYFAKDRTFYLSGGDVSYVMHVTPEGNLMHLYWGKRVTDGANDSPDRLLSRGRFLRQTRSASALGNSHPHRRLVRPGGGGRGE